MYWNCSHNNCILSLWYFWGKKILKACKGIISYPKKIRKKNKVVIYLYEFVICSKKEKKNCCNTDLVIYRWREVLPCWRVWMMRNRDGSRAVRPSRVRCPPLWEMSSFLRHSWPMLVRLCIDILYITLLYWWKCVQPEVISREIPSL